MNKKFKGALSLAAAGALVFSLAACSNMGGTGTTDPSTAPTSSSTPDVAPEPVVTIDALTGDNTQVAVDAAFLDAITGLGLTPGVTGGASLSEAGVLEFPITGGNVTYYDPEQDYRPYVQGSIEHEDSGFTLTAGDTTVELKNFVIDPGTSKLFGDVYVNDELAAEDVFIFKLDGSTLMPLAADEEAGTGVLEGTRVLISEAAAPLLNETFGTDAIQPDMLVGIAKITVNV